jgi:hypothetical protein
MSAAETEPDGLAMFERELGTGSPMPPTEKNAIGVLLVVIGAPVVAPVILSIVLAGRLNSPVADGMGTITVLFLFWLEFLAVIAGGISGGLVVLTRRLISRWSASRVLDGIPRDVVAALVGTAIGTTVAFGVYYFGWNTNPLVVAAIAVIPFALVLAMMLQLGQFIHRLSSLPLWQTTQRRQSSPASD